MRPTGITVQTQPNTLIEQTGQVAHVGVVVAVANVHQVQVNALLFEDAHLLLTHAVGGPGVGADASAGSVAGPGSGAQHYFLVFSNAATVAGDLDDAGLDAGVFDALLDFLDEQGGDTVNGSAPKDAGYG